MLYVIVYFVGGITWFELSATGGRDRPGVAFDAHGYLRVVAGRNSSGQGTAQDGVSIYACPNDAWISSQTFNNISSWIKTVSTVPGSYSPPSVLGLTNPSIIPINAIKTFQLQTQNALTPWNGRSFTGLYSLPYSLTYSNWSYVINSTYTTPTLTATNPPNLFNTAGQQIYPYPVTTTAPANSLYLFGGGCGHSTNYNGVVDEPDVWTSPDNGVTWNLFSGAHGISGTNNIYVAALSGDTPSFQTGAGENTGGFATTSGPWTYAPYPLSMNLHDNVNHRFYILGGDSYGSSGHWIPTKITQESGYPTGGTPLIGGANNATILNTEGLGWTNLCLRG